MIFRVPDDLDADYGLQMTVGAFTTTFHPAAGDCTAGECRVIAPFDAALRGIAASQSKVSFSLKREGSVFTILAPLAGLGEALEAARRDPIGLVALQHKPAPTPEPRVVARQRSSSRQASNAPPRSAAVAR